MVLLNVGSIKRKVGGLEAPQSSLEASKSRLEAPKSRPGASKIEFWGLQKRAWSPPRHNFEKMLNLRSLLGPTAFRSGPHFEPIPLNSPRGGPPPPPHLCARMLGDCHALKACICRAALLKAHGEMKAHILATICPDFAMNLRRWQETLSYQRRPENVEHFRKIGPKTL